MDTGARAMIEDYACAMVYIEVKDETGKLDVGSGFTWAKGYLLPLATSSRI